MNYFNKEVAFKKKTSGRICYEIINRTHRSISCAGICLYVPETAQKTQKPCGYREKIQSGIYEE
jgi:hypothetical protein